MAVAAAEGGTHRERRTEGMVSLEEGVEGRVEGRSGRRGAGDAVVMTGYEEEGEARKRRCDNDLRFGRRGMNN